MNPHVRTASAMGGGLALVAAVIVVGGLSGPARAATPERAPVATPRRAPQEAVIAFPARVPPVAPPRVPDPEPAPPPQVGEAYPEAAEGHYEDDRRGVDLGWMCAIAFLLGTLALGTYEIAKWARRSAPPAAPSPPARPGEPAPQAFRGRRVGDLIELPGPPRATVRFHHHAFWEGEQLRQLEYTEFAAEISGENAALRIATAEWHSELGRFYSSQDIVVGDAWFDRRYVILCNAASAARDILDGPTRDRIRRLDAMGTGGFVLVVRPRTLVIRVGRRLENEAELQRFIDECIALARRLMEFASMAGMEITAVTVGAEATCQVCGTPIEPAKRVLCRKCRTPHHADCWAYNDGCSIFACGERENVRG